jgi:hypothetical protein
LCEVGAGVESLLASPLGGVGAAWLEARVALSLPCTPPPPRKRGCSLPPSTHQQAPCARVHTQTHTHTHFHTHPDTLEWVWFLNAFGAKHIYEFMYGDKVRRRPRTVCSCGLPDCLRAAPLAIHARDSCFASGSPGM